MDIFNVLSLIGGLALFLFGMKEMGDGLAKMAGGKLEQILEKLTSKRIFAVLLGAGVTAIIQSSSATTVMVVGFVNSGIMQLSQAVGIIMGANIGTTVTSWLLSLTGISGSTWWIKLLKPSSFSPVMAAVGMVLMMTAKESDKKKDVGNILLGFAILMFGMETMSSSVSPLSGSEKFTSVLTMFSNPILGLLVGAGFTAIIQSSSASIGILQALCLTGIVPYSTALPIIMGQNIGTCVTSIISSAGATKNARRASMIHLYFNIIGTTGFMLVFYLLNSFMHFDFLSRPATAVGIATIHSLFNIGATIVLYPFSDKLVRLSIITIPDKKEKAVGNDGAVKLPADNKNDAVVSLDERFLERPAFATEIARTATGKMAEEAYMAINMAMDLFDDYDNMRAEQVIQYEQRADEYEDALGSYLIKISSRNLSKKDSQTMSVLLHSINDLERITDHAVGIQDAAKKIRDNDLHFSKSAREELRIMTEAVRDITRKTVEVFEKEDIDGAISIIPFEEAIDHIEKEIKQRHVKRLRKGKCTIELGLVLEDILTVVERVSDHCSNIAVAMIEIHDDEFDTHAYTEAMNKSEGSRYYNELSAYENKYRLPEKNAKIEAHENPAENSKAVSPANTEG